MKEAAEPERRMDGDRRRGPQGWLEIRAQRDGIEVDRRAQSERGDRWARWLHGFRLRGRI